MKRILKINMLLCTLIMMLGAICLSGCDKDNEILGKDVYRGYIERTIVYGLPSQFIISVIQGPYDDKIPFKEGEKIMPAKGMSILAIIDDPSSLSLEVKQKILFRVISSKKNSGTMEDPILKCKIEILKKY